MSKIDNLCGVTYWEKGNDRRIFVGTGDAWLIALIAETGEPIPTFGNQGRVDLTLGLRRGVSRLCITASGTIIYRRRRISSTLP